MAKKKTSIPIDDVIKLMIELLKPYIEPTDSLSRVYIKHVLSKNGYETDL